MGITIDASVTLEDYKIADAMAENAMAAAHIINALNTACSIRWHTELLKHLDDDGRALILLIAAALDAAGGGA
jgi:hypothetical protein